MKIEGDYLERGRGPVGERSGTRKVMGVNMVKLHYIHV
jgi:hypothetical protein